MKKKKRTKEEREARSDWKTQAARAVFEHSRGFAAQYFPPESAWGVLISCKWRIYSEDSDYATGSLRQEGP